MIIDDFYSRDVARKLISTCLVFATIGPAYSGTTADFFAMGALTRMQLSIADAEAQGKVSHKAALCVKSVEYFQFLPAFNSLLQESLSSLELTQSDQFFSSSAGIKYARQGLIQVYTNTGHTNQETIPTLTGKELNDVEAFSRSSAGTKLINERVLESPDARKLISARIKEIFQSCR
jgi:hypothetical protein